MEFLFIALIPVVSAVIVVILARRIASHTFKCNNCLKDFRIKWSRVLTAEHSDGEYMLVCPHCKTKDWCTEQPKDDQ